MLPPTEQLESEQELQEPPAISIEHLQSVHAADYYHEKTTI